MRHLISVLLCFFVLPATAQMLSTSGRVTDKETGEPVAFVRVAAAGTTEGTLTDIDGHFSVSTKKAFTELRFSVIGYETQTLKATASPMNVKLKKNPRVLGSVVILPGENPAHRIIRNAQEKSNDNNPEKYSSFSYRAYNKFYATAEAHIPDDTVHTLDTIKNHSKLDKLLERQHLFLCESVSERIFSKPASNKETVTASRVSGLQTTTFSLISTQLQSFSFYEDQVNLLGKFYVSPLSRNSESKYLFIIQDTLISGSDSIFIISFQPRNGKNFEAVKGVVSITTSNWAVTSISAEPAQAAIIIPHIQQKYEQIKDKEGKLRWFPVQLNTDWFYMNTIAGDTSMSMGGKQKDKSVSQPKRIKVVGRSYMNNIEIGKEIPRSAFRGDDLQTANDATAKDENWWTQYRRDSLNKKDQETYRRIDSLGKAENFDRIVKFSSSVSIGVWPTKYFDIDLKHLINYNFYEGIRPGFGMHTGSRISRFVSVGGYGAYGFRDKAFKYGADLRINLHKASETWLEGKWSHDVLEAGSVVFEDDEIPKNSELYYRYYRRNFDRNDQYEARFHFITLRDLATTLRLRHSERTAGNDYMYSLVTDPVGVLVNRYRFTDIGAGFRFGFREKYGEVLGHRVLIESKWPVLWLDVSKGVKGLLGGDFEYTKLAMKTRYEFHTRYFGRPGFILNAGWVEGDVPYSVLFGARGTNDGNFQVSVAGSFETMDVNEFFNNKYAAFFYTHTFELFRGKKFNPDLVLRSSVLFGTLSNASRHSGISMKGADKGYYESGLMLNNLIRSGFTGLGVGAFYRYGSYARPETKDNIVVKLTIGIAL